MFLYLSMNTRQREEMALVLVVVIATIIALNVIFFNYSPDEIVTAIGVQNAYLVSFLIACVGGVNSITGGVLYVTLITFAAGGASPWLLGLTTGIGIGIGDLVTFSLFRIGVHAFSHTDKNSSNKLALWKEHFSYVPHWLQYTFVYLYVGITPLPSDILLLLLASLRYRYRVVAPLVFAGGITFATLVSLFGEQLAGWF